MDVKAGVGNINSIWAELWIINIQKVLKADRQVENSVKVDFSAADML